MNRRGFLRASLGLLAAPAIVRAASIMPVRVPLVARQWSDTITYTATRWTRLPLPFVPLTEIPDFERLVILMGQMQDTIDQNVAAVLSA